MKKIFLTLLLLYSIISISQTISTNNKLIIPHGDITLYLTKDTCTLASKHVIIYSNYLKLDKERDNRWFQDTYKKYNKNAYLHTGYDLGHLTPSHITSYDNTVNHNSFSLYNQAPQLASFNRGKWAQLEASVEDSIGKYKRNAIIITGVIYDSKNSRYLGETNIPIPISYFKVLYLNKKVYCWIGSNINGEIIPTTLIKLNQIFVLNKMFLKIK